MSTKDILMFNEVSRHKYKIFLKTAQHESNDFYSIINTMYYTKYLYKRRNIAKKALYCLIFPLITLFKKGKTMHFRIAHNNAFWNASLCDFVLSRSFCTLSKLGGSSTGAPAHRRTPPPFPLENIQVCFCTVYCATGIKFHWSQHTVFTIFFTVYSQVELQKFRVCEN